MKLNYYIVTFKNGKTVFATCFNKEEAEILSKALMIKSGFTREIESIVTTNDLTKMKDTDYIA